jgi:hypothetical protein
MNPQVGDAGQLLRDPRRRDGDSGYMLAGRNVRGRDAGDGVVGTDLNTGANLFDDERSINAWTDASVSAHRPYHHKRRRSRPAFQKADYTTRLWPARAGRLMLPPRMSISR